MDSVGFYPGGASLMLIYRKSLLLAAFGGKLVAAAEVAA
jgi:hypothetical protein